MRVSHFLLCVLFVVAALSNSLTMAARTHARAALPVLTTAQEAKIEAELLTAVQADAEVEANIMVQLGSTDEIIASACGGDSSTLTRAEKTTCMVENMQTFAEEAQKPVKALLQQYAGQYSDASFLWINNSVSLKRAKGSLVLALATIDAVVEVRVEQIFHTMGGGKTQTKAPARNIGFGILN